VRREGKIGKKDNISKITHCAIRMFSARGYAETSLREISQAAQVGLGTINFYFQSKEELFIATVKQVVEDTNGERHALLVRARREGLTLEGVLEAMLWPFIRRLESMDPVERAKPYLLRRAMHGPAPVQRRLTRLLDPVASEFVEALREILPGLSRQDAFLGFSMAVSVLFSRQVMDGRYHHLIEKTQPSAPRHDALEQTRLLVGFVSGGLRAVSDARDGAPPAWKGLNARSASVLSETDPLH
jgi:AcrR family transcriptional regulator